jgi:hypothetical protein
MENSRALVSIGSTKAARFVPPQARPRAVEAIDIRGPDARSFPLTSSLFGIVTLQPYDSKTRALT